MALIKRAKPADAIEEEEQPLLEDEAAAEPEEPAPIVADDDEQPGDADTMAALAAVPAEPAGEAGSDSLLDMFSTVGIATVDRTALLDLAGEVEIDDLISELSLVAAALGLVKGQHAMREDEDEAMAA